MFGAEQALGAFDRERFYGINIFASAVPTFCWITFGVLVSEDTALRLHHGATGEIFRCDQLDVFPLPFFFGRNRIEDLRIDFAQTAARCIEVGGGGMQNIAHDIVGSTAATPAGAHGYFALFYKSEHARQGVFDRLCAGIIDVASQANGIGHVTPASRTRFFKFAQQESLVRCIWKKHLDCFDVRSSHRENMRRAFDECAGERLAPQIANFGPFLHANVNRMRAGRLSSHGVHSG